MARRDAPAWIRLHPIAHRGLHDAYRPENSLSAFEAAAAAGYPIELDVHATRDGQIVVFHDEDLHRMTGSAGRVADHTLAQLQRQRLYGTEDRIPSLVQTLDLVDGRVPVVVELKSRGRPGALEAATWNVLRDYRGEIAVQSFNPRSMAWFRREAAHVPRGLLASDFAGEDLRPGADCVPSTGHPARPRDTAARAAVPTARDDRARARARPLHRDGRWVPADPSATRHAAPRPRTWCASSPSTCRRSSSASSSPAARCRRS